MTALFQLLVSVAALALITWGCVQVWLPLGPLMLGLLLLGGVIWSRLSTRGY